MSPIISHNPSYAHRIFKLMPMLAKIHFLDANKENLMLHYFIVNKLDVHNELDTLAKSIIYNPHHVSVYDIKHQYKTTESQYKALRHLSKVARVSTLKSIIALVENEFDLFCKESFGPDISPLVMHAIDTNISTGKLIDGIKYDDLDSIVVYCDECEHLKDTNDNDVLDERPCSCPYWREDITGIYPFSNNYIYKCMQEFNIPTMKTDSMYLWLDYSHHSFKETENLLRIFLYALHVHVTDTLNKLHP